MHGNEVLGQYKVDTVLKVTNPQYAYPTLTSSGDIYFEADVEGNWEIYRMQAVTNGVTRLTHNKVMDRMPSYNNINHQIAFISDRDGDYEVHLMDTAGDFQTQVTNNQTYTIHPYWSPDGQSIIFNELHRPSRTYDIKSFDLHSKSIHTLLDDEDLNSYAQLSPNGNFLVFDKWQNNNSENGEIYLLDTQTKELTRLTNNKNVYDGYPAWFSNNKHIIYSAQKDEYFKLYYLNIESPSPQPLTSGKYDDQRAHVMDDQVVFNRNIEGDINIYKSHLIATENGWKLDSIVQLTFPEYAYPSYSPNEDQVLYQAKFFDKWQLYTHNFKTGKTNRLTNKGNNEQASWSPDGKSIVYVSDVNGHQNLYLLDSLNEQKKLTNHTTRCIHPFWHPEGESIIFNREVGEKLQIWEYNFLENKESLLFTDSVHNSYGSFSPDGSLVAYVRWLDNNGEIYLYDTRTQQHVRMTSHSAFDGYPMWMPDGKSILFSSNRSGVFKLHLISVETGELYMLNPKGKYPEVRAHVAPLTNRIILNMIKPGQLNLYEYQFSDSK